MRCRGYYHKKRRLPAYPVIDGANTIAKAIQEDTNQKCPIAGTFDL